MNRDEIIEELIQSIHKINTNSLMLLLDLIRTYPDVNNTSQEQQLN